MAAGFSELAAEAGTNTALSFKGSALVGVLHEEGPDITRTEPSLGRAPNRLLLMISRAALNALAAWPKVGESFDYGAGKLNVKDIEGVDPTDPVVNFIVKKTT